MSLSEKTVGVGLKIVTRPEKIYIEKSSAGQVLNCDFIVENSTDEKWIIKHMEICVFDALGQFVTRKFVDESGSIQTIPNRELDAGTSALIFNPFFLFDHHVELQTLQYRFTFASVIDERERIVEATISPEQYSTKTRLSLPVRERAIIWDGHDFYSHHRRFNYLHPMLQHFGFETNFERYGYDFVPVRDNGEMFQGDSKINENWLGFGKPVFAPANGIVADLFDGMPDNRKFDELEIATREMVVFGNYIIIDHQNGEYSCLAHLKQGSISVRKGWEVQQGQIVGHIGASGSSLFPHLHYELRNGIGARDVDGLPSYFHQFRRLLGSRSIDVKTGPIDTGDIVEPINTSAEKSFSSHDAA